MHHLHQLNHNKLVEPAELAGPPGVPGVPDAAVERVLMDARDPKAAHRTERPVEPLTLDGTYPRVELAVHEGAPSQDDLIPELKHYKERVLARTTRSGQDRAPSSPPQGPGVDPRQAGPLLQELHHRDQQDPNPVGALKWGPLGPPHYKLPMRNVENDYETQSASGYFAGCITRDLLLGTLNNKDSNEVPRGLWRDGPPWEYPSPLPCTESYGVSRPTAGVASW